MAATKVKPGQQVNGTLFEYVIIYGKTVSALEVVQSVRTTHSQLHASVFCSYFWCILVPLPVGRQLSIHNAEWQASRYVQATSISLHAASMRLNEIHHSPNLAYGECGECCVITITNAIFVIHIDETLNQLISHCCPMDGGNEWTHCFILVHHTLRTSTGHNRAVFYLTAL